ncbi:MAG: GerMN domain-containing protein [Treponema sp.]|nr:GerMN domain-containing protein [Treponema sp.]
MSEKKNNNKKPTGLGFALWILAALIILVLFLINQNRISTNLKATGFLKKTMGENPEFVEKSDESSAIEKNDVQPIVEPRTVEIDLGVESSGSEGQNVRPRSKSAVESIEQKRSTQKNLESEKIAVEKKEPAVKKDTVVKTDAQGKTMKIKLYFMTISSSGSVSRREITRVMKKSDSPLVDAINAIIRGPSIEEEKTGCRTLVSSGTKLIGASVRNGTAVLNFSGEFEFNQYGSEGLIGQLQQVVFTATAFNTVKNVQILIDGEKKEYLGSEGVWIGTPLTRNNF